MIPVCFAALGLLLSRELSRPSKEGRGKRTEMQRTVHNIAGLDLLRDLGPDGRVNLLVLAVKLGLKLDDLGDYM